MSKAILPAESAIPATPAAPVESTGSGDSLHPFSFSGTGREYFGIWIVNVLLSIVTLGIYSAWAKVRTNRYFYGNTTVLAQSFAYLADPVRILKGRIIAVVLLAAYFVAWQIRPEYGLFALTAVVLVLPAVIVMASAFTLRNSAWRNIRFGFRADIAGFYRRLAIPLVFVLGLTWITYIALARIGWAPPVAPDASEDQALSLPEFMVVLFMLLVMPLLPYLDFLRTYHVANNASFGRHRLRFSGRAWGFYRLYLATFGILLLLVFVAGFVTAITAAMTGDADNGDPGGGGPVLIIGALVLVYLPMLFVAAFVKARRRNLIYNQLSLDGVQVHSTMRGIDILWLWVSNAVLILVTLGLAVPWARVRMARYQAQRTELEAWSLEHIVAGEDNDRAALGEEFGDMFGFDLGF